MTGNDALTQAVVLLRGAGIADPAGDARRLLAHAMGIEAGRLTIHLRDDIDAKAQALFFEAISKRQTRMPVSQIVGGRWFYDRWFRVSKDVLDPRPETEILVKQALCEPFSKLLDLGLGSGCILLTLLAENPLATGIGTDISPLTLSVACENAKALKLEKRSLFMQSNWFSKIEGRFDLIVSNPPYISADEMAELAPEVREHEPKIALTPGGDGLEAYRAITARVMDFLEEGGRLIVEIGPSQGSAVCDMFRAAGLQDIRVLPDLDGRDRVVQGRKPT
ncbi:MAG: peptide chain release factor N(5)-glutamine methyltransferase [Rhodobacteraceae bacterium]|nr:peptide chain release factor N(5)-glutamine methyltransferase [Paracoccaceae bacterium]